MIKDIGNVIDEIIKRRKPGKEEVPIEFCEPDVIQEMLGNGLFDEGIISSINMDVGVGEIGYKRRYGHSIYYEKINFNSVSSYLLTYAGSSQLIKNWGPYQHKKSFRNVKNKHTMSEQTAKFLRWHKKHHGKTLED